MIELRNHPSQARHPVSGEPLFDDNGVKVPMFPNQRGIYLDGYCVGYVGEPPTRPICLTRNCPQSVCNAIKTYVDGVYGKDSRLAQPPPPQEIDDEDE